ncbi:MAG: ATP synthase F1 subunit gamma [Selenomonadaceae bacterium]|nr:ATP synthase F1 subunit gamma [Selenomonadaceae bacterium]
MASLQDIRRRIKSVKSIQQITNAMNMVATSRLRRAKEAATANKPYADKVSEVVNEIAANAGDFSHPLLERHEGGKKLILVLAADKGLAGAYSSNVFKEVVAHIQNKADTQLITVGRKSKEHFKNRGYTIVQEYSGISERPHYEHAREIAQDIIRRFESGEIREIDMVYSRFVSAITCIPETVRLLPFEGAGEKQEGPHAEYIYEPSAEEVLGFLLPQYLVTVIYAALLQAAASELSSRMNAMSNATDNAGELIAKLDLHYNKVRQAGITNEINEIVGGAEALK